MQPAYGSHANPQVPPSRIRKLFANPESIDREKFVIARYRIAAAHERGLLEAAARLALLTTLGTVDPLPYESNDERTRVGPRIIETTHHTGEGFGDAVVALPIQMFGTSDVLTMLLNTLLFSAEYNFVREIKLRTLDLPGAIVARLPGPTYGADGVRSIVEVQRRPILCAILKPRAGVPLQQVATAAYESLVGGCDFVMDDELVVDPDNEQRFELRVRALVAAVDQACRDSGEKKGVAINVTGRPSICYRYACRARDLGAQALVVNAFTTGTPSLQDLVTSGINLPIFACNVGSGVLTRAATDTGIEGALYSRFSRLGGADAVQTGILAANAYTTDVWGPSVVALDSPLSHIKPSLPIVAGGLNIANLWLNWSGIGDNAIFAAGYGILGYPGGARIGAKAFRAIVTTLSSDMSPFDALDKLLELATRRGNPLEAGLTAFGFDRRRSVGLHDD